MKRILSIVFTILIAIIIIGSVNYYWQNHYISLDEAQDIVLKDIAFKNQNYYFTSTEFNKQNYVYTLKLNDENNYYEYQINAHTKKIIYMKKKPLDKATYLPEEEILNIVFNHAKINKENANILSQNISLEDYTPIYNVVFYYLNKRYEYKVNAFNGTIISIVSIDHNN